MNGWVPLATLHWPSFMREARTGGSWRILQSRFPLLAGRQGTYFSRRMFSFQGSQDASIGIHEVGRTVRGYCSKRLDRHPPGSFSIAGAVLPV